MTIYLIRSTTNSHDYWNNLDGWGHVADASVFAVRDGKHLHLPIGGQWVKFTEIDPSTTTTTETHE